MGVHSEILKKKPIPASALISENVSVKIFSSQFFIGNNTCIGKNIWFMPIVFIDLGIKLVKSTSKLIEPPLVPL